MKKVSVIVLVFISLVANVFAQTSENEMNMSCFNVEGITLGTPLSEFKQTTAFSYEYDSSSTDLVKVYVSIDVPNMDICFFSFFEDSLYRIEIYYDLENFDEEAEWRAIFNNLVSLYGKFDSIVDGDGTTSEDVYFEASTMFVEIGRWLLVQLTSDDFMRIMVLDTNNIPPYTE